MEGGGLQTLSLAFQSFPHRRRVGGGKRLAKRILTKPCPIENTAVLGESRLNTLVLSMECSRKLVTISHQVAPYGHPSASERLWPASGPTHIG